MGDMLVRGIPDALKTEIAESAKRDGQSLSDKAIEILRKGVNVEREEKQKPAQSAWEALRSAVTAHGPLDDEYAKIMDEIEAERKKDFGRPLPDFE
jgi:plasmid stability protein